jgi:DNA-binding transcriptional MerR regulator
VVIMNETRGKTWTVSEAAKIAGVTVRALHHYDSIGLLTPEARTEAGYRLYRSVDLERLQQILLMRQLGMPLEEIRRALDDPGYDRRRALQAQHTQLEQRLEDVQAMLRGVDAALSSLEGDDEMTTEKMFEGLGLDQAELEAEAKERWGETDSFKESARRTKKYGKEDWAKINAEADAIYRELQQRRAAGVAADDEAAMELAEQHRQHIDRWFYPCSHEMHAQLAEGYVADERFTAFYDRIAEGLAVYLRDAIVANGARGAGA